MTMRSIARAALAVSLPTAGMLGANVIHATAAQADPVSQTIMDALWPLIWELHYPGEPSAACTGCADFGTFVVELVDAGDITWEQAFQMMDAFIAGEHP